MRNMFYILEISTSERLIRGIARNKLRINMVYVSFPESRMEGTNHISRVTKPVFGTSPNSSGSLTYIMIVQLSHKQKQFTVWKMISDQLCI